jgi:hypothetical protein
VRFLIHQQKLLDIINLRQPRASPDKSDICASNFAGDTTLLPSHLTACELDDAPA